MARPIDVDQDQQLLGILRANARMPLTEIARTLKVSRATVQARIARLERDGMIGGYTILPGPAATAVLSVQAIVLMELDVRRQDHVVAQLRKRPEVLSCHTLSGQFDMFVTLRCPTPASLDKMIDWIAAVDGVRRTTSSILLASKINQ
ncbi:MAG: Lrp/AsnC family transcriptional regulator [Xanthobacteraceae bacterium]|jgi:DNA-binding Lrp family transcriptional regulator